MNNTLEVVESRSPSPILTIENARNESNRVADITNQLNKLKAKLLKAKMLKSNSVTKLQKEYDDLSLELEMDRQEMDKQEKKRQFVSHNFGNRFTHAENKSNKLKRKSEREEDKDIMELLREEKNSKSGDQVKHMVNKICRDGGYKDDLEYIEERAEHFASKDNKNNKKDIDYKNYKKNQEALDKCQFCFKNGQAPVVPIISMGQNAYLALPTVTDLVPGHCLIIPGDHCKSSLDCDDATWNEIRNFMKSLMRMFATLEKGVIFMETVINLNHFKHTVIECIPLPWDLSQDATAYFKEGLIDIADEWSQHKKIINTKERTFRKSMTSNLPYFHVWFHPDGGLGHIIEESEKFKSYFGKEIIAGMLDLDISLWRKPKYQDSSENKSRVDKFNKKFPWENYDWTKLLD